MALQLTAPAEGLGLVSNILTLCESQNGLESWTYLEGAGCGFIFPFLENKIVLAS